MYNTNIAGIVDLTIVRNDGSEQKHRFTNAITDYGLDYLTYYRDTSDLVSSVLFTQGTDEVVDVTKLNPAYVEGTTPLRIDNFDIIKSATMWEISCTKFVRTTRDGFHNPQQYSFDEINLMAPHPDNQHDAIYEAVFAKCKIRDADGNVSLVSISEGERLILSYKLIFNVTDTTLTETAANKLTTLPPWVYLKVNDGSTNNYTYNTNGYYDDAVLYAKRVPYTGEGHGIVVDFQPRKQSTSGYETNARILNLGVYRLGFSAYYTELTPADIGKKYHVVVKFNRFTPADTIGDGSHGTAVNKANGEITITAPPLSMVLVYDKDRLVTSYHLGYNKFDYIQGHFTLPTKYTYGWTTTTLSNREPLDCFLVTSTGLKHIGVVNAVDSIGPLMTKGAWNEAATEFSFYCEPKVTYHAVLGGRAFFWEETNLNGWTKSNTDEAINSPQQRELVSPTWTTVEEEMGEADPDKPTHRLVTITFPYPVRDHVFLTITAYDEYGNHGYTPQIYPGKTDYFPLDWTYDYFKQRSLLTDSWDPQRIPPSYLPSDTLMGNFELLDITIEDIE